MEAGCGVTSKIRTEVIPTVPPTGPTYAGVFNSAGFYIPVVQTPVTAIHWSNICWSVQQCRVLHTCCSDSSHSHTLVQHMLECSTVQGFTYLLFRHQSQPYTGPTYAGVFNSAGCYIPVVQTPVTANYTGPTYAGVFNSAGCYIPVVQTPVTAIHWSRVLISFD